MSTAIAVATSFASGWTAPVRTDEEIARFARAVSRVLFADPGCGIDADDMIVAVATATAWIVQCQLMSDVWDVVDPIA